MIPERVLERVRAFSQGSPVDCWPWPKSVGSHGYGQIGWYVGPNSTMTTCQRASWEAFRGPIPEGLTVDHECRNRVCWNPGHLRLLTNEENGRDNGHAKKTHCPRGHLYDEDNTRITKGGRGRACKACEVRWRK